MQHHKNAEILYLKQNHYGYVQTASPNLIYGISKLSPHWFLILWTAKLSEIWSKFNQNLLGVQTGSPNLIFGISRFYPHWFLIIYTPRNNIKCYIFANQIQHLNQISKALFRLPTQICVHIWFVKVWTDKDHITNPILKVVGNALIIRFAQMCSDCHPKSEFGIFILYSDWFFFRFLDFQTSFKEATFKVQF